MLLSYYSKLEKVSLSDYKTKKRMEMRLRRWIFRLSKKGILFINKIDGLIWVKANFESDGLVDLIKYGNRISQTPLLSNRLHPERYEAQKILRFRHRLSVKDWRDLGLCLEAYRDDVDKRIIVLKHTVTKRYLFKRYRHRFSKRYLKRLKAQYDSVWREASKRYDKGVFITLTMNPSTYTNLYDASRNISKAFNRFMSFLTKRLGFRPAYISVFEPMDSGNPHLHVVVFGISTIMEHYQLTEYLKTIGFGEIHFEYRIVKRGNSWVWAKKDHRPRGSNTIDVESYLEKYLTKTFSSLYNSIDWRQEINVSEVKLAYYFASNKRFFTYSTILMVKVEREDGAKEWIFIGSWSYLELPSELIDLAINPGIIEAMAQR